MPNWQSEAFWQYSLALYQHDEVKTLCLGLQDDAGLNINLLLLCCWLNQQGMVLSQVQLAGLLASLFDTDNTLQPLRAERRKLGRHNAHYKALLEQELVVEKQQQQDLISQLNSSPPANGSHDNLLVYASTCGLSADYLAMINRLGYLATQRTNSAQ